MKNFLLFFFFLSLSFSAFSQGQFSGKIIDSKSKLALSFASVSIKNIDNDKLLGAKADLDGDFKIDNIPYGLYTATISFVGYEPKVIPNIRFSQYNKKTKLDIEVEKKNKELGTVVIEYEKKAIEIQADKKVFNVEKNISSQGGTLRDVLRNVPGVNVNADGSVALRGKTNVTILIDGKQNPLLSDLETALQSIPAENIQSIEVITNPSAKYEAQGLGGIINIVMKEGKQKEGFSGTVNAGVLYNWRYNAGVNLAYRPSQKFGFFLNANGGYGKEWEQSDYIRSNQNNEESYQSVSTKYRTPRRAFASFGIEYKIDERNSLVWTNSAFQGSFDGDDYTNIYERNATGALQQYWFRNNVYNAKPANATTNLKYSRTYKNPKQKLNVEANYSSRSYIRESDFLTEIYDGQTDNLTTQFTQRNPVDGGNSNGAFQIDYEHPLGKDAKIEVGERTYLMNFSSENFPTIQFQNQPEQTETILKNNFNFLQQVHGAYINYASKYKSFSFQAGLRGEYFSYGGTAAQLGTSNFTTDYIGLFPSAFLSKKIDEKTDVNLNYSRRVNRPSFFQLLPFVRVNSPLDTSIGNPSLQPEFINAFELSYSKLYGKDNTFFISAYYQLTDNIIQRFRRFNPDGSTFSQTQNLSLGSTFGIELTNQIYLLKGWDITLNANGFRNIINGNSASSNQDFDGYGGFVKLVSNTNIGKTWQLQLSGNYFAPKVIVQGQVNGFGFMDVALKKSFLDKQLNVTLQATDIFNTLQTTTVYYISPSQTQSTFLNEQTRFVGINVQYSFPKKQKKNYRPSDKKKEAKDRDDNLKDGDGGGY